MANVIDVDESGEIKQIARQIDLDFLVTINEVDEFSDDPDIPNNDPAVLDPDQATVVNLTEPQTAFLLSNAKFRLFVAGFGAGKSTCMIAAIFEDLSHSYTGIKIGAYCPTYDLLNLITIPYIEERLYQAGIDYRLDKSKFIFYLETGDQIIMRSMDNPSRIVGYQTFRAHIDEIDTLDEKKAEEAWNKIIARNRQKIPKLDENGNTIRYEEDFIDEDGVTVLALAGELVCETNKVSAYSTPEGFRFCYKRWVKEKKQGYEYIQAPTYSNPHNPPDYIPSLRATYPEQLIDAYIEGKFVNLTSGSVYPEFDRELNHTDAVIEKHEPLHIGMDFNVNNMSAAVFVLRDGKPLLLEEIVEGRDTPSVCQTIEDRYVTKHRPKAHITIYPDSSGKNTSSKGASRSDISIIKNEYGFRVKADSKNPAVKDRVNALCAQIHNGSGERHLLVNTNNCPQATDCLEQQVWDKNGEPDKKSGKDHMPDAIGYFIYQLFPIIRKRVKAKQVMLHGRPVN